MAAGHDPGSLLVVELHAARAQELTDRLGIAAVDAQEAARRADVLVVAVKPGDVTAVLDSIHDSLDGRPSPPTVVSLAAGIPTTALEARLPSGTAVVRVMPNTPMLVGEAMSAVSGGAHATDPVRGMRVDPANPKHRAGHGGRTFHSS